MIATFKYLGQIIFLLLLNPAGLADSNTIEPEKEAGKQREYRILTYNVRNCRGLDNLTDYMRVAEIIKRINPDIVALQELDSATQRSNGIVVLNELASETKMHASYSASIAFQGGKYGVGILSAKKPIGIKTVALPGREERRSLLIAEFDDFIFCCTHLSLNEEDRLESARIINSLFDNAVKPVILGGDLNAVPESSPIKALESKWTVLNNTLVPTIPADNPRRCIDYILARKSNHRIVVKESMVEKEPLASDHLPVWVRIKIK